MVVACVGDALSLSRKILLGDGRVSSYFSLYYCTVRLSIVSTGHRQITYQVLLAYRLCMYTICASCYCTARSGTIQHSVVGSSNRHNKYLMLYYFYIQFSIEHITRSHCYSSCHVWIMCVGYCASCITVLQ